jgi:hypothetical protein
MTQLFHPPAPTETKALSEDDWLLLLLLLLQLFCESIHPQKSSLTENSAMTKSGAGLH